MPLYDPRTTPPFIQTVDFKQPRTRLQYEAAAPETRVVDRLAGESLGDLTARVLGANTGANRARIAALNPVLGWKVTVPK